MSDRTSSVDVAVVGAGAAGLGAAGRLRDLGVSHVVLEAAHRIGGRAYTEEIAPGVFFDLGCHWMHSASLNPFVAKADAAGFHYSTDSFRPNLHMGDRPANDEEGRDCEAFFERCYAAIRRAAEAGRDLSVAEVTERDSPWTAVFDYVISLLWSTDSDQVSVVDQTSYRDTQENWPLERGYGNLIALLGEGLPIRLNAAADRIDWSGKQVRLATPQGEVRARRAIVTVSTGILGGGDIRFVPDLPNWKQEAIAALPIGNHNRICLLFDRNVLGETHPPNVTVMPSGGEPMAFRLRPFGQDCVVGLTGGRFADWLERAGVEASADLAKENLKKVYGSDIAKHVTRHVVTAWRGDPWIKGAYSAAKPGQAGQRAKLAEPLDERLFFAGEASSLDFFSTAHGAYLTGIRAAEEAAASLAAAA